MARKSRVVPPARVVKEPEFAARARRGEPDWRLQPKEPAKLRGRPPLKPRTTLARWIQAKNRTVTDFAEELRRIAPRVGLTEDDCPQTKTLTDAVNARHWPHPKTILLVRHATGGEVDLEHWVRDLA